MGPGRTDVLEYTCTGITIAILQIAIHHARTPGYTVNVLRTRVLHTRSCTLRSVTELDDGTNHLAT